MAVPVVSDFNGGTVPTTTINSWLTALRFLLPVSAIRTSDSTPVNNSATLVNDTVLLWPLAANATYEIFLRALYTSNTTANFKFAFTFPAGCRLDFGFVAPLVGVANGLDSRAAQNLGTGVAVSVGGGAVPEAVHVNGTIVVGGTPGTLQFQWSQNTANVSNTFTMAGSSGTLRQVA